MRALTQEKGLGILQLKLSHVPHPRLVTTKFEVKIEIRCSLVVCFSFVLLINMYLFKDIFSLCFVLVWVSDFLHCLSACVAFSNFSFVLRLSLILTALLCLLSLLLVCVFCFLAIGMQV